MPSRKRTRPEEISRSDRLARLRRTFRSAEANLAKLRESVPVGIGTELVEEMRRIAAALVEVTVVIEEKS